MLLLFALSHANDMHQEEVKIGEEVGFAWDETTQLSNSQKDSGRVLQYLLYVTDKKIENKDHRNPDLPQPNLITENKAIIKFDKPGQFYIGVATAIYSNGAPVENGISHIAWSHDKYYTNSNPFLVKVEPKIE